MDSKDYGKMVHRLFRDPETIHLTVFQKALLHAATGVAGEGGEVLDEVKKHCFTGKELDMLKLVKEMGDVEFYLEAMRQVIGISREEILQANMDKLSGNSGRYSKGYYSDEQAQARKDVGDNPLNDKEQ